MGGLSRVTFELVMAGGLRQVALELPPGSHVSVTASPQWLLEDTLTECEWLVERGHIVVPHIAARQVADAEHLRSLLARMERAGLNEMLLIAGDAVDPSGPYRSSVELLADLLAAGVQAAGGLAAGARGEAHGLERIGVAAYPDGHPRVPAEKLHEVLLAKQQMLNDAGIASYAVAQMCADASVVVDWLTAERAAGVTLPVSVGVAGAVSPAHARRIASAIRIDVAALLVDAAQFIEQVSAVAEPLGITGFHVSTFNEPVPPFLIDEGGA